MKAAEAFGFNQDLGIPGAATSTIPAAGRDRRQLAVGSIGDRPGPRAGDGAADGVGRRDDRRGRRAPAADAARRPRARPPASASIRATTARTVREYMEAVVKVGTGVAPRRSPAYGSPARPAPPSSRTPRRPTARRRPRRRCPPVEPNDPTDTDAWFAAFAPAKSPRIAVGVLLVQNGAGGDTAAPVARQVMVAAFSAAAEPGPPRPTACRARRRPAGRARRRRRSRCGSRRASRARRRRRAARRRRPTPRRPA